MYFLQIEISIVWNMYVKMLLQGYVPVVPHFTITASQESGRMVEQAITVSI